MRSKSSTTKRPFWAGFFAGLGAAELLFDEGPKYSLPAGNALTNMRADWIRVGADLDQSIRRYGEQAAAPQATE